MTKQEIIDYFKDINEVYNDCTRLDSLARMLNEVTASMEWIPVSERLPKEKDGKVLICMPDKFPHNQSQPFLGCEVSQRVTTGEYSEFSKRWYIGDMCGVGGDDPIAWMPLPEPTMMDLIGGNNGRNYGFFLGLVREMAFLQKEVPEISV